MEPVSASIRDAESLEGMDDAGLIVWSMGSPIGKIPITEEDFPAHLAKLCHVLALADALKKRL